MNKIFLIVVCIFFAAVSFTHDVEYVHIRQFERSSSERTVNYMYRVKGKKIDRICYIEFFNRERIFLEGNQQALNRYWSQVNVYRFKLYLEGFSSEPVVDKEVIKAKIDSYNI